MGMNHLNLRNASDLESCFLAKGVELMSTRNIVNEGQNMNLNNAEAYDILTNFDQKLGQQHPNESVTEF